MKNQKKDKSLKKHNAKFIKLFTVFIKTVSML